MKTPQLKLTNYFKVVLCTAMLIFSAFATTIRAEEFTATNVIAQLEANDANISNLFAADAGVHEHYTIKEHTLRVLQVFQTQKSYYQLEQLKLAAGVRLSETLIMTIALHDIGKPRAITAGNKWLQHEFTIPILEEQFIKYQYSSNEIDLAKALVDNDIIGELLQGQLTAEQAVTKLQVCANEAHMQLKDFFALQQLFYVSDAGSYPFLLKQVFKREQNNQLVPHAEAFKQLADLIQKTANNLTTEPNLSAVNSPDTTQKPTCLNTEPESLQFSDLTYNRHTKLGKLNTKTYQVNFLHDKIWTDKLNSTGIYQEIITKNVINLAKDIYTNFGINTPKLAFDYAVDPNYQWYDSIVMLNKDTPVDSIHPYQFYDSLTIQEQNDKLLVYSGALDYQKAMHTLPLVETKDIIAQIFETSQVGNKESKTVTVKKSLDDKLIDSLAEKCGLKHSSEKRLAVITQINDDELLETSHMLKSNAKPILAQIAQIHLLSVLLGNNNNEPNLRLTKDNKIILGDFNNINTYDSYDSTRTNNYADLLTPKSNTRIADIFQYAFEKYTNNHAAELLAWLDANWDETKLKTAIENNYPANAINENLLALFKARLHNIKTTLNNLKTAQSFDLTTLELQPQFDNQTDSIRFSQLKYDQNTHIGKSKDQLYYVDLISEYHFFDSCPFTKYNSKENAVALAINIYRLFGVKLPKITFDYAPNPYSSSSQNLDLAVITEINPQDLRSNQNSASEFDAEQILEYDAKKQLISLLLSNTKPGHYQPSSNTGAAINFYYDCFNIFHFELSRNNKDQLNDLLYSGNFPAKVELLKTDFEKYTANKPKEMAQWLENNWDDAKIKALINLSGIDKKNAILLFTRLKQRLNNLVTVLNRLEARQLKFSDLTDYDEKTKTAKLNKQTYYVDFFDDIQNKLKEITLASKLYQLFGLDTEEVVFDYAINPHNWFNFVEILDEKTTIDSLALHNIDRNTIIIQKQAEQLLVYTHPFTDPKNMHVLANKDISDILSLIPSGSWSRIPGMIGSSSNIGLIQALAEKCGFSRPKSLVTIAKINQSNLAKHIKDPALIAQIAKTHLISVLVNNTNPNIDINEAKNNQLTISNFASSLRFNNTAKEAFYALINPTTNTELTMMFKYPLEQYTIKHASELAQWLESCGSDENIRAIIKASDITDDILGNQLFLTIKSRLQDLKTVLLTLKESDLQQKPIVKEANTKARTFAPQNLLYKFEPAGTLPKVLEQMKLCCNNHQCWLELKNYEFMVNSKESNQLVKIFIGDNKADAITITEAIKIYDPESAFVFQDAILRYSDNLGNPKALSYAELAKIIQIGFDELYYHFALTKTPIASNSATINTAQELVDFIRTQTAAYASANSDRSPTQDEITAQEALGLGFTAVYANPIHYGKVTWYKRPIEMSYNDYATPTKISDKFLLGDPGYLTNHNVKPKQKNLVYDKLKRIYPLRSETPVLQDDALCPLITQDNYPSFSDIRDFTHQDIKPIPPGYVFRGADMSLAEVYQSNGFQAPAARNQDQDDLTKLFNQDDNWKFGNGPDHVTTMKMYISTSRNIEVVKPYGSNTFVLFTDQGLDIADTVVQTNDGKMPYHYETVIPIKVDFAAIAGIVKNNKITGNTNGPIYLQNALLLNDPQNYWQILQIMGGKPQVNISQDKQSQLLSIIEKSFNDLYTNQSMDHCKELIKTKLNNALDDGNAELACIRNHPERHIGQIMMDYEFLTSNDKLSNETIRDNK